MFFCDAFLYERQRFRLYNFDIRQETETGLNQFQVIVQTQVGVYVLRYKTQSAKKTFAIYLLINYDFLYYAKYL